MQWISIRETNCAIHWIDFYPVDSAIQRLNNRGQVNYESRSGESTQGESRVADELCKASSKAQSLYIKQRFAKGVQRNITDFE